MKLHLSSDLTLPLEAVTQTFAILAKRGVGKTYTALVVVEELLKASLPVVVIDPIGVCWGLRASADGRSAGLPIVVLGGDHGDVPLDSTNGETIARLIVEERLSAVIDLSLMRKGEQTRFMTDFAERLYHSNREPLHLVLDEADSWAPQRPMPGQQRLLGAVEDLVRRGRARGIGVTLVTQRSAVLNKDVLTQVEVLVALRTIAPQDRNAIDEWIKVHGTPAEREELMKSLPSLPVGTAWFWSPGWLDVFQRVRVRQRETFDSSATPKVGMAARAPKKLADVDLSALRERLSATIEKAKADDPRELRRQIADLQKQLDRKPEPAPAAVERVEVPVIADVTIWELQEIATSVNREARLLVERLGVVETALQKVASQPRQLPPVASRPPEQRVTRHAASLPAKDSVPSAHSDGEGLGGGALRRILIALAQNPAGLTDAKLAVLTNLRKGGSTMRNALSKGRVNGWLEGGRDRLVITNEGIEALGDYEPLPTGKALRDYWRQELGDGAVRKIFDLLVAQYPQAGNKQDIAARLDLALDGSTMRNALSKLRVLELIERGQLRASDTLFMR